ncbi:MAG: TolC family protein, partial [Acidobacteriota bacterium]
ARNPPRGVAAAHSAAARAVAPTERGLPPPMLEAQLWRWPVTTLNPTKVQMVMLMGQQTLPARGRRDAAATLAVREAAMVEADEGLVRQNVVEAVSLAYVGLVTARASLEVYARAVETLRQIGDASLARYASVSTGVGQQDVLQSMLALSRLEQDRIRAREDVRRAEVALATLLGRDPASPVEPLSPPPAPQQAAAAALAARAVESAPEILQAQAALAAADAAVALVDFDRKPEFVVRGGYMLEPGGAGAVTASVGVTWPHAPWSRSRLDAVEAARRARRAVAQAAVVAAKQAARAAVHDAAARLDAARARAAIVRTTVIPQARQTLDVARVAYTSGQVDFLTVIDGQRLEIEAELEAIRAEGEVLLAAAALDRASGGVR